MTLQTPLHKPAYAGIYAYRRRRVDPVLLGLSGQAGAR